MYVASLLCIPDCMWASLGCTQWSFRYTIGFSASCTPFVGWLDCVCALRGYMHAASLHSVFHFMCAARTGPSPHGRPAGFRYAYRELPCLHVRLCTASLLSVNKCMCAPVGRIQFLLCRTNVFLPSCALLVGSLDCIRAWHGWAYAASWLSILNCVCASPSSM